jgi:hypothetical protein
MGIAVAVSDTQSLSKHCLDQQGRFVPRIFLGQAMPNWTPYTASQSASANTKDLTASLSVGSYNVPRDMGIDMDSALTII